MGRKKTFDNGKIKEKIEVVLRGKLRLALYLYMEDNETNAAEALRDGVRALCQRQLAEIKNGRKPKAD